MLLCNAYYCVLVHDELGSVSVQAFRDATTNLEQVDIIDVRWEPLGK